ncbi:MAG: hypothetical protein GY858_08765 [Candidatus Omnitrophica bacterium]|nr:hypothetical protein [Candidatus Omnitrophota bacterium]
MSKAISSLCPERGDGREAARAEIEEKLLSLKSEYLPQKSFDKFWLLNTDISPQFRPHSPSLASRRYVYKANNKIKGNKPVGVGYEFSTVGLNCRRPLYGMREGLWNLPLSMLQIPAAENKNRFTAKQVNRLLDNEELPFGKELTLNALDSNYLSPEYMALTFRQKNLVNVIRLASNRNVWKRMTREEQAERRKSNKSNKGTHCIYGEKYKLNQVDNWILPCDEETTVGIKLASGKKYLVSIRGWNDMMIRSKRGESMKDKPFRLLCIKLLDPQTLEPIYKRALWLSLCGKRNKEVTLEEAFWAFRNRFDIEHFFRFGKQNLLLDSFQTPIEENLDNWLEFVSLAYWILWVAQPMAKHSCPKWQQYDPNMKNKIKYSLMVSPSQVQRQLESIILSFEQSPFFPKQRIKGKGRKKGMTFPPRKKYPVIKKVKKPKKQGKT